MSKQLPASSISVEIGNNTYNIDFPSNGKLIQIERYKNELTGGTGRQMLMNGSSSSMQAYIASEAIATFTILIPKLSKDMLMPLTELNQLQSKSLIKAYEKYYEWMEAWREALNEDAETEEEEKKESADDI